MNSNNLLPNASPTVIHQQLADGAVLFDPAEEVYFGLNEVGSLIWSLLPPETETFGQLCDKVCGMYPDVERTVVEADTSELLAELLDHGLVKARAGAKGDMSGGAAGSS